MITPIEDIEYINFFQYLSERLKTTYGEDNFKTLIGNQHFVAGMDLIASKGQQEALTDMDIVRIIYNVNLEMLKDLVVYNFTNTENGVSRPILDSCKVLDYFLHFKLHTPESKNVEDMKIAAETLVGGFYYDVFSEH